MDRSGNWKFDTIDEAREVAHIYLTDHNEKTVEIIMEVKETVETISH
jgi:hypothetical protein